MNTQWLMSCSGEDPATEDEVGRGAPEAAILYCDTEVNTRIRPRVNDMVCQVGRLRRNYFSGDQICTGGLHTE